MEKVTFYKTMFAGNGKPPRFEATAGWQKNFYLRDGDLIITLNFDKRESGWTITEEKTGLRVGDKFKTRADAEKGVTIDLLKKIREELPKHKELIFDLNIERGKRYAG